MAPGSPGCQTPLHITLVTKVEYAALGRPRIPDLNLSHVYILGAGTTRAGRVRWLVAIWNHGNSCRRSMKLPPKDFHITLTDEDDHNTDKSILSMDGGESRLVETFDDLDQNAMDHVLASKTTPLHSLLVLHFVRKYPESYKSYIRLGDCSAGIHPRVASLSYARALELNPSIQGYVRKRMLRMIHEITWGPIMTARELQHIQAEGLKSHLLKPWTGEVTTFCSNRLWTCPIESREKMIYLGQELPRFFTWLYPHRLAGMSTPRHEADIDLLMNMGITTVLTLTAEEPLNPAWFEWKSIKNIYIPVANYDAPTIAEMDIIYHRFRDDTDGRWLVHCGGGKGRAGSVLACLIAMYGYGLDEDHTTTPKMDKSTAIKEIRSMRPGSIESEKQEQLIGDWISHRWAVAQQTQDVKESITPLQISLDNTIFPDRLTHSNVKVCILVGIPGSGKSWLAKAIAKRRKAPTIIISQDESGSRQSCENAVGLPRSQDTLIILDRCNPDANSRREWLSLMSFPERVVAVYFEYARDICLKWVDQRLGHPTVRAGRGKNHVNQMSKLLQPPSLGEGYGAVLTVSSFAAAREAIYLLGGPAPLIKFPRTPHLIDLGATTSDDLVVSTQNMSGNLTVEEKIDGANMGFALDWDDNVVVQNRSHYVSSTDHAQFKPLASWIETHHHALYQVLARDEQYPERYILYGEWVVARHSIGYTSLPDRFLAFDLYDRLERCFLSRRLLTRALEGTSIAPVPMICEAANLSTTQLIDMVQVGSRYYDGKVEGVYVRTENQDRTRTVGRGKVVRSDFIAGNEHWTKGPLVLNGIVNDGLTAQA
ncbi:hypothetical protein K461DRAFT_221812 [Myriangium duriaei CBS 260.36]|uniref:Tyrosine specific protein phosphatases domain-containing protein n=1 Tax=Myriangium duriaei CBS 260.36 TaxID=1168546 RepID=A0A9P4J7K8_9PEZI|nr:hypothetical protein K461DRAFT_221812 [Myriangium duriaei CBS 260.36]